MSAEIYDGFNQDGRDWDYLKISSDLAEPICFCSKMGYRLVTPLDPNKFDNFTSTIKEVAFRALIAFCAFLLCVALPLTLVTSLTLGGASKIFKAAGYAHQKDGFTHVRGEGPEKSVQNGETTAATINICGIAGGFPLNHGGVIDWRPRIDELIEKLRAEDPDTIVFQEVFDTAIMEKLVKELGPSYAHFFTHLGSSVWGTESGVLIMTKLACSHFSNTTFSTSDWQIKRGFGLIELKDSPEGKACLRIVGTHLEHGYTEKSRETRTRQVAEIVDKIASRTLSLPTFLAGDLNIERDQEEGIQTLSPLLEHGYTGEEPTCTNTLIHQWDPSLGGEGEETVDYFSRFKPEGALTDAVNDDAQITECHLIETYTPGNTRTALSDHKGISVTIALNV